MESQGVLPESRGGETIGRLDNLPCTACFSLRTSLSPTHPSSPDTLGSLSIDTDRMSQLRESALYFQKRGNIHRLIMELGGEAA